MFILPDVSISSLSFVPSVVLSDILNLFASLLSIPKDMVLPSDWNTRNGSSAKLDPICKDVGFDAKLIVTVPLLSDMILSPIVSVSINFAIFPAVPAPSKAPAPIGISTTSPLEVTPSLCVTVPVKLPPP